METGIIGKKVKLYKNHQEEKEYIGVGELIKKLPTPEVYSLYILFDEPEYIQTYYTSEKWLVKIIESDFYPEGYTFIWYKRYQVKNSKKTEDNEKPSTGSRNIDSFLKIDGEEIF